MTDDQISLARLGVTAALREGDSGLAYRMVRDAMDDGVPMPVVVEEVLAPIQWESGRRWESGDATISEEHVSTAAIETLVSMLAGAFDQPPDGELVVVVCAEGDDHSLPARMASALLAYEGYRTLFLGTSVPAPDLAEYLESADADVLLVSCSRPANLLGARACVAAGHGAGIPVVVGGRAFGDGPDRWGRIGADAHAPRLSTLAELLQTWQPDLAAAERRAAAVTPSVRALLANRSRVADAVHDALTGADPDAEPVGRQLLAAAEELVDSLAVASYLGDPALLAAQARWLADLLASRAGARVSADQLLGDLAEASMSVTGSAALVTAARGTLA